MFTNPQPVRVTRRVPLPDLGTIILTARWLFPVDSPPLERGTLTIHDGGITAVEPHGQRSADVDLGNAALMPGLVNAHTHLDLSGLAGQVPPGPDFTAWLRAIIAFRRGQTPEQVEADIRTGLEQALDFGTTLLGDIAGGGDSWEILRDAPCRSLVFFELLGLPADRVMPVWERATGWLNAHPGTARCRVGLSPHAPYSVHKALFRAAGRTGLPLAIHLAESLAERQLLDKHTGPFADFLKEVGVWDEEALVSSHEWLLWRSEQAPSLLLAHGNYLNEGSRLPPNATVIYCPRTHAAFGHAPHPFRDMLNAGVRVALGTDSLASNPDLDVLAEARFLAQMHPEVPGETLLRMATLSGAEALGFGTITGSLHPGKWADLCCVPLPNREAEDPHELVLEFK